MRSVSLYPLRFAPIFRPTIWGGHRLLAYKGLQPTNEAIGECWELSPMEGDVSVVANGALKGATLNEVMCDYGRELLGEEHYIRYGGQFPLLIKLIDAAQELSVQVHPGHNDVNKLPDARPKNEMWYVLDGAEGACLSAGFNRLVSREEYLEAVRTGKVEHLLSYEEVKAGNLYFISSGRVHAIGAGCFILEVQEPSNTTFRIYDYNRVGQEGNARTLHTEEALSVIDFSMQPPYLCPYREQEQALNILLRTPYFVFASLVLHAPFSYTSPEGESCAVFFAAEGSVTITDCQGHRELLSKGHTLLVSASLMPLAIEPLEESKLLVVYLPH